MFLRDSKVESHNITCYAQDAVWFETVLTLVADLLKFSHLYISVTFDILLFIFNIFAFFSRKIKTFA